MNQIELSKLELILVYKTQLRARARLENYKLSDIYFNFFFSLISGLDNTISFNFLLRN